MRYWLDTEFIEDGKTIDLISIGIVSEDGRKLYLQSCEFDPEKASVWVKENVLPHLKVCPYVNNRGDLSTFGNIFEHPTGQCKESQNDGLYLHQCPWRSRKQMRRSIFRFIDASVDKPEFYGWCSGYDFVALCQLFGTMMDLPEGWPHYIKDLQQVLDEYGIPDDRLPQQEKGLHNALEDARHIKDLWNYVEKNYVNREIRST